MTLVTPSGFHVMPALPAGAGVFVCAATSGLLEQTLSATAGLRDDIGS